MLLVQEFLKTHSFKELQEQHGVYASFSKSGHKWSLNYDMLEAKESDLLAQECRGLILSAIDGKSFINQAVTINDRLNYDHIIPGETRILAYPMNRFFNYGQGAAAEIDWNDPKLAILEKLDGTLCIVYWDPFTSQWCVATRSVSEADLLMDNGLFTFRSLFEKATEETLKMPFSTWTNSLVKDNTYCFELTTPYNRIVVQYDTCGITLLSARHVPSLREFDPQELASVQLNGVPVVKSYKYSSINDLLDWVSNQNPMEHEGVVIRDSTFRRLKVKNAAYVAYNRVRDTLATSERNCLELIFQEKEDDVLAFLPEEIGKNLLRIKEKVQHIIKEYDEAFRVAKEQADLILPGDKKTFAILVTKDKKYWTSPFFAMFDGKATSMKDFIANNRKDGTWANSFLDKFLEMKNQNHTK